VRARAPASSANLGPGFDTLAVALGLHVEVEIEPAGSLRIETRGEGSDLPVDAGHLAVQVAAGVLGHDRFFLRVSSDIPVGRGLGSSAALAVAAAAAAGADRDAAFSVGVQVDGHPENAAASAYGGLVGATVLADGPTCVPFPLDERLAFVVLVPDRPLSTASARAALPGEVSHRDAAFNLGRMALLLAGLADIDRLRAEACEDRLHQGQRAHLFPEAAGLIEGLVGAGARGACWSGAGPTLLALCAAEAAEAVRSAGQSLMAAAGVAGRSLVVPPDPAGLVTFPG